MVIHAKARVLFFIWKINQRITLRKAQKFLRDNNLTSVWIDEYLLHVASADDNYSGHIDFYRCEIDSDPEIYEVISKLYQIYTDDWYRSFVSSRLGVEIEYDEDFIMVYFCKSFYYWSVDSERFSDVGIEVYE